MHVCVHKYISTSIPAHTHTQFAHNKSQALALDSGSGE